MADVDALEADIGFDLGEIESTGATDELAMLADLGYTFELAAVPAGGAPAVFTIDLTGGIGCSGILIKQIAKTLAGAVSPTAISPKVSSKLYASTTTGSGVLLKTPAKIFKATLTPSATTTEFAQHQRSFSGATSPTGSETHLRSAQRSFTGQMFSDGHVSTFPSKLWSGATTPAGTLSAVAMRVRTFLSSTTSFGTLSKLIAKQYGGSLNASGTLSKVSSKALSGIISPASSVERLIMKTFAGSSTSFGTVATFVARLQSFGGTLTATGRLSFDIEKIYFGFVTPGGTFEKGVEKAWSAAITPSSTLTKEIPKSVSGAATSAGSLTTQTTRTFTITRSGQIAPSGIVDLVFVEAPIFVVDVRTPGFRKSKKRPPVVAAPLTYARWMYGAVATTGRLDLFVTHALQASQPTPQPLPITADDIVSIQVIPRTPFSVVLTLPRTRTATIRGRAVVSGSLDVERVLFVDPDELIYDGGLFDAV